MLKLAIFIENEPLIMKKIDNFLTVSKYIYKYTIYFCQIHYLF